MIFVVHGRSGSGKTTHREALRRHFGAKAVHDDPCFDIDLAQVGDGDLVLVIDPAQMQSHHLPRHIRRAKMKYVPIDDALRAIGVNPIVHCGDPAYRYRGALS